MITQLADDEIFVFGSNESGHHGGGAALYAVEHFGAVAGQGEGLQGRSYAIPTMGTAAEMVFAVSRFKRFAHEHPELRFMLTPVGTGIAGRATVIMAALFDDSPPNVILPPEFKEELLRRVWQ